MQNLKAQLSRHKRALTSLLAAALTFAVFALVWFTAVRGQGEKSLSVKISDDYTAATAVVERTAAQTFPCDEDLLALAFVFAIPGEQPAGELLLTLQDADTGEVLATSTGDMANIVAGQYTGLGLDRTVAGAAGRRYRVVLAPQYTGAGRLALGCSEGAALWDDACTVDDSPVDATLSLIVTYRRIGGFLTKFYWCIALALTAVLAGCVWLALGGALRLHRAAFVLIVLFGLLYSAVLPPYAAPDEQYHINQSFTLACRWANVFSSEDWSMGHVPLSMSYRRVNDTNPLLQDENTTVFTWQEAAANFFTTTGDAFDSHLAHEEAQVDTNPVPYLPSAAAVFLCFLLRLGFVPTLFIGRLANLLVFAALAAWAVKRTPFGRRIFFAAALLPMSLHLAASFSRDGAILGLCFAFTALCLDSAFAKTGPLPLWELLPLGLLLLLLAPAKAVYLPLALLVFLIPAARLGSHGHALKWAGLALCLAAAVFVNRSVLAGAIGLGSAGTAAATAETAAPATEEEIAALLPHAQPHTQAQAAAEPGWHYVPQSDALAALDEDTQAAVNAYTAEGFVRRLYFYGEGRTDEPAGEVAFWAEALQRGEVSAALLGQSFFFGSEQQIESYTPQAFASAVSLAFMHRDLAACAEDAAALAATAADSGLTGVYKTIYSAQETTDLFGALGVEVGCLAEDEVPLDRAALTARVEAARAADAQQSIATGADAICYTPGYILRHPADTLRLAVNSLIQNGDHYLRTLVGGSLSYYTLELAWGWVLLLYLLLAFAALPAEGEALLPAGRPRAAAALIALLCCALAVAGCITWTPTYYTAIYGLQGRYFLPVLPLLLLGLAPRRTHTADSAGSTLLLGMAAANAGALLNAMLAVMAR